MAVSIATFEAEIQTWVQLKLLRMASNPPLLFLFYYLIPPLVVIIAIALKAPAIPGIYVDLVLVAVCAPMVQGTSLGDILSCIYEEFVSETVVEAVVSLLPAGGFMGMIYSISLTIMAMMFGGIMNTIKQLQIIVDKLLSRAKRDAGLVTFSVDSCVASNITMSEQYISLVVSGRMYA